jgi:aspartyl-tRNA(Asn)/glutamyl-tRNA(Gln) amidotransferase subunit A
MPKYKNLQTLQADIQAGIIDCVGIVAYYLQQIEKNEHLNAFIETFDDEALSRAHALDKKFHKNPASVGRLFGAVISIKDVICYQNHKVSAAAKILEGFTSVFSATAVERLLAEDAIIIGRTNCDQFAMGSTNENSYFGATRNADDPTKIPGGSSGGAAVSVQADMCLIALGSDTGGSVRQPAGFCGVVGLKPTYGRVSRHGLLAYASSFDQIGVLTHSVSDAALVLEVIAGADDFDATASTKPIENYKNLLNIENQFNKKLKIAYLKNAHQATGFDAEIKAKTENFMALLRGEGHEVTGVEFDLLDYIIPAYYVLTTAEASSNLSRYDGIRYGRRAEKVANLEETYRKSRTEGFSEEVKRRILLGTFVLSSGYYDAYYTKAQKVRRMITDRTAEIFSEYDFILMPTSPIPAWQIGAKADDPVAMYLADIFTVQANMVGIPAIALPIGRHTEGGHIGIQFLAKKFEESKLLAIANYVENLLNKV